MMETTRAFKITYQHNGKEHETVWYGYTEKSVKALFEMFHGVPVVKVEKIGKK